MSNEFEVILDVEERTMGDPKFIFGFVLLGLQNNPNMRIQDILELKKLFDKKITISQVNSTINNETPRMNGMSRKEKRAMRHMEKKNGKQLHTKKKKK